MSGHELPASFHYRPQPSQQEVAAIAKALRQRARRMALVGFLWLAAGLGISIGSYLAAPPGGTFTVLWGAAIFGAYKCVRGLYFMADPAKLLR